MSSDCPFIYFLVEEQHLPEDVSGKYYCIGKQESGGDYVDNTLVFENGDYRVWIGETGGISYLLLTRSDDFRDANADCYYKELTYHDENDPSTWTTEGGEIWDGFGDWSEYVIEIKRKDLDPQHRFDVSVVKYIYDYGEVVSFEETTDIDIHGYYYNIGALEEDNQYKGVVDVFQRPDKEYSIWYYENAGEKHVILSKTNNLGNLYQNSDFFISPFAHYEWTENPEEWPVYPERYWPGLGDWDGYGAKVIYEEKEVTTTTTTTTTPEPHIEPSEDMLYVAFGGALNYTEVDKVFYNDSPSYYAPGYNESYPIDIEVPFLNGSYGADQIYILIGKMGTEELETIIDIGNIEIDIKDSTTGELIDFKLVENNHYNSEYYYENWDDENFSPLILVINNNKSLIDPNYRHRLLDCFVKNKEDNSFIKFSITIQDQNKTFHYISVDKANIRKRNIFSAQGKEGIININNLNDTYVLISPFAFINEVKKGSDFDFSYPLNSFFYRIQQIGSKEGFKFIVNNYSHLFILDNITLMNVPGYRPVGLLLIDKYLHTKAVKIKEPCYIDVKVIGDISKIEELFRINFRV